MDTLSHLLKHAGPQFASQLKFLTDTAQDLHLGVPSARTGSALGPMATEEAAAGIQAAGGSFLGNRKTLRETLKIKFGNDHLVSTAQVKEVQLAMSQVGVTLLDVSIID